MKTAYPNYEGDVYALPKYDTDKWLQAISDIYRKEKFGVSRQDAIKSVVNEWSNAEIFHFTNWTKFYEAGDHMKYKAAQVWYENDSPGYFLHIKKDQEAQTSAPRTYDYAKADVDIEQQKRLTIERQRNKIIGRLDSAEKLLRSPDGHLFSGQEYEALLEIIYQLKKKIQLINKISSSTKLYHDMIVREANVLSKKGFFKAASVLFSLGQTPAASAEGAVGSESAYTPSPVTSGDPASPGSPQPTNTDLNGFNPSGDNTSIDMVTQPKGITEFLNKLDGKQFEEADNQKVEDVLEVNDFDLNSFAQTNPVAPVTTKPVTDSKPIPQPAKETTELEVTDSDPVNPVSQFDDKFKDIFSNVTVADVVVKLEDLAKIFKSREISRQLSLVDMMLAHLGLATYFPSLAEAIGKTIDSTNYASTRIEDVLAKLRGALNTNNIDLSNNKVLINPEASSIANKLEEDQEKDKLRKQMRKEQENLDLESKQKETPEIEVTEDFAAPPAPVAPPQVK